MATLTAQDKLKEEQAVQGVGGQGTTDLLGGGGVVTPGAVQSAGVPRGTGGSSPFAGINEYLKGGSQGAVARAKTFMDKAQGDIQSEASRVAGDVAQRQDRFKADQAVAQAGIDAASKLAAPMYAADKGNTTTEYSNLVNARNAGDFGLEQELNKVVKWANISNPYTSPVAVNQNVLDANKDYASMIGSRLQNQFKKEGRGGYSAGEKALDSALISKSQGIADKAKSVEDQYNNLVNLISKSNQETLPALSQAYDSLKNQQTQQDYERLKQFGMFGPTFGYNNRKRN